MSKNAFFGYKYVRAILVLLFLSLLLKLYFIKTILILILVLEDIDFFPLLWQLTAKITVNRVNSTNPAHPLLILSRIDLGELMHLSLINWTS